MFDQDFVAGLQMKSSTAGVYVLLVVRQRRINPLVEANILVDDFDKNLKTSSDTPEDNCFPGKGYNSTFSSYV